mmetsp:Transcript_7672/g.15651  ORF Transcript_7672/g.15651 Transcript_7672/m.15651 type:complete len:228 (+) Transcript_7672:153-836(+)
MRERCQSSETSACRSPPRIRSPIRIRCLSVGRERGDADACLGVSHDSNSVVDVLDAPLPLHLLAPMLDGCLHVTRLDLTLALALRDVLRSDDLDRTGRCVAGRVIRAAATGCAARDVAQAKRAAQRIAAVSTEELCMPGLAEVCLAESAVVAADGAICVLVADALDVTDHHRLASRLQRVLIRPVREGLRCFEGPGPRIHQKGGRASAHVAVVAIELGEGAHEERLN